MDIQRIVEMYNNGASLAQIAREYNTYGEKIKKILQANGVRTRTHAEQNMISNQARAKSVNHQYFKNIDTWQKAWILGFLAADGSISKDRNLIKIGLSSVDREILEKIRAEIQIERNIQDAETNNGFFTSTLVWSSEHHKHDLKTYGIVPNKTYQSMSVPELEEDFQLAFILGFYDGDGCFKNDGATCRLEICAYRSEILESIADIIYKSFNISKKVYKSSSRENYYTLTYSTKEAIIILDKLYNLKAENFCLKRKLNKYNDWKRQNNRI